MSHTYTSSTLENAWPAKSFAGPKTHTPGSRLEKRGYRFYHPGLGRWASRDPLNEEVFLLSWIRSKTLWARRHWRKMSFSPSFLFVGNDTQNGVDVLGLSLSITWPPQPPPEPPPPPDPSPGLVSCLQTIVDVMQEASAGHGGSRAHCVQSCKIGKASGGFVSWLMGLTWEELQYAMELILGFTPDIDDALDDLLMDNHGLGCSYLNVSCEACCCSAGATP